MEKELKIGVENAMNAYKGADENGKKMLEALFGKETFIPKDIRERVKTFEDACEVLGNDHQAVVDYFALCDATASKDIIAYAKLRIIAEALNEGWKPQFTEDEYRYYPWYYLYTEEEWAELDESTKKYGRVLGRSSNHGNASGGLAYASAAYESSGSYTSSGSRLAFKTYDLAEYCGKQFIDIWIDFLL